MAQYRGINIPFDPNFSGDKNKAEQEIIAVLDRIYPESVTSNLEFPYKNIQIHKVNC